MSDDKKRDRALQNRVRDRQAKTGESYQTAWRHVAEGASAGDEAPSAPKGRKGTRRVPLSLGVGTHAKTGKRIQILPGQSAQITARPQLEAFWPDRLVIKNADRWHIDEFYVGEWKDWDAAQYAKRISLREVGSREPFPEPEFIKHSLLEAGSCAGAPFSLRTWQPLTTREVLCGEQIVLIVTYTGKNPRGEGFEAALFGWDGQPPVKASSTKRSDEKRITERAEAASVVPHEMAILPLTVTSPVLFVDRLTIMDAKDWVVNNIAVRNKSIFVQSGELPGEMFSDAACVILEPLTAKDRVEVAATYIGNNPSACLKVELSGMAEPPSEPRTVSCFLPMSTGVPIEPTQSAQITGRTQSDFLPERLVIADSDEWSVNDIKVGTHSQLATSGDIPGQSFSIDLVEGHGTFGPVVRKGQDFIIVTTREEDCKKGAPFWCGVQGRLA
jgi:hypothetical protein